MGKAANARTYFFNLINKIQRLTQASQRRQKWRFFPPFPAEEWGISQFPILPKRFLHLQCWQIAGKGCYCHCFTNRRRVLSQAPQGRQKCTLYGFPRRRRNIFGGFGAFRLISAVTVDIDISRSWDIRNETVSSYPCFYSCNFASFDATRMFLGVFKSSWSAAPIFHIAPSFFWWKSRESTRKPKPCPEIDKKSYNFLQNRSKICLKVF